MVPSSPWNLVQRPTPFQLITQYIYKLVCYVKVLSVPLLFDPPTTGLPSSHPSLLNVYYNVKLNIKLKDEISILFTVHLVVPCVSGINVPSPHKPSIIMACNYCVPLQWSPSSLYVHLCVQGRPWPSCFKRLMVGRTVSIRESAPSVTRGLYYFCLETHRLLFYFSHCYCFILLRKGCCPYIPYSKLSQHHQLNNTVIVCLPTSTIAQFSTHTLYALIGLM